MQRDQRLTWLLHHQNVPHLLEEEAEYENPTSVLVNLVNTNATAIWKASLACLPPHGSGVAEEYLVKLVEAADSALLSKQARPSSTPGPRCNQKIRPRCPGAGPRMPM